jgi:O-antigen ligase
MNRIIKSVNVINLLSALFLAFISIYSYNKIHNITLYIFFISYFLEIILEKKWSTFKWDKSKWLYIAFVAFFLLILVYHFFEENNNYFDYLLEKRLPLIGFAVVGLLGLNKKYKIEYFSITFLISSLVSILIIFYHMGIENFIVAEDKQTLFSHIRIENINNHMVFDFYLNLTIVLVWYLLSNKWSALNKWSKTFLITGALIILSVVLFSEGRSGFIAANVLLLSLIVIYFIKKNKKYLLLGILICIAPIMGVFISNHSRMDISLLQNEPRIALWAVAIEMIQEKPIIGYGASNAQVVYDGKIKNDEKVLSYSYFVELLKNNMRIDSHNQFLQTMMEFGLIGLFILLFIYFYPIYITDKKRRLLIIFYVFLTVNQSIFDMFLTVQFSLIFCLMLIVLLQSQPILPAEGKSLPS